MFGPCTNCGKMMCECPPGVNRNLPFANFTPYLSLEDKIRLAVQGYYRKNRKDKGCGWWLIGGKEWGDSESDFEAVETDYDTIKHYHKNGWSESPWSSYLGDIVRSMIRQIEPGTSIDIEAGKVRILRNSDGKFSREEKDFDTYFLEYRENCRRDMEEWRKKSTWAKTK